MSYLSKFGRVILSAAAAILMTASAYAQSTILIVDQSKILRESEVGKHINRQLESIGKTMESELKAAISPLESEKNSLIAEIKALGGTNISTRPDLQSRRNSLAVNTQKQKYEAVMKQRELAKTEAVAYQKVSKTLEEILKVVVAERNADVVIDRSAVIYGKPADVTDLVLSRLNSQLRTVQVTRERLPRQAIK